MKRSRTLILVALLLTLISTFFLYRYVESLRKAPAVEVKYEEVIVAANDIPQHTKITEEMIKATKVPVEAIHSEAARKKEDIVGKITKFNIVSGEQILSSKIAIETDTKTGLSYKIPENMRAVVVPTDEVSGLAGYLERGDKVDIVATYEAGDNTAETAAPAPATTPAANAPFELTTRAVTITQIQNLEVLEVGVNPNKNENAEIPTVPTSVTLLVTPQQAEVISFMLKYGSFQMTLRNPVDGVKVPLDHYGNDNFNDWRNR